VDTGEAQGEVAGRLDINQRQEEDSIDNVQAGEQAGEKDGDESDIEGVRTDLDIVTGEGEADEDPVVGPDEADAVRQIRDDENSDSVVGNDTNGSSQPEQPYKYAPLFPIPVLPKPNAGVCGTMVRVDNRLLTAGNITLRYPQQVAGEEQKLARRGKDKKKRSPRSCKQCGRTAGNCPGAKPGPKPKGSPTCTWTGSVADSSR